MPGSVRELVLGSWRRTAVVGGIIALLIAVIVLAAAPDLLRHSSFPGHPYPPAGFAHNPLSSDPDDLISVGDANKVKTDLLADGEVEVEAFARGDRAMLDRADTGNRLAVLRQLLDANTTAGIVQQEQDHHERVVVGRLPDPRDASVTWCVQESGTTTLVDVARSDGSTLRTIKYRFEGRFWLRHVGDRYLIADAEIMNQQLLDE